MLRLGAPLSAALHAAAIALLLPHGGGGGGGPPPPPIEVELIQATAAGAAPSPPAPPEAAEAPPVPQLPAADGSVPPAPPPAPPRPAAAPAVNLGNAGEALADMNVTGDNVVPPRPDSRHRNLPPAYPPDAVRQRLEGTVRLLVHVTGDGIPLLVEVAASSGHPSLDRAARQAVERWRFNPALGPDGPVPFDYPLSINFIGDHR